MPSWIVFYDSMGNSPQNISHLRTLFHRGVSRFQGVSKHSNPYMVADIAAEIGAMPHMPTEAVLSITHCNTQQFFNLIQ